MIRYRLDDLGWFQFEWMCQSLLKSSLGVGIEAWGGHSDLGRDAYWPDTLPMDGPGSKIEGPFVFQSKFVSEANAAGSKPEEATRGAVKYEVRRIGERLASGNFVPPSVYVLMTNVPLSATFRTELIEIIREALDSCRVITWGADDICALLDNAPNIRVAFPQLLGLRDLSELLRQVVDSPLLERSSLAIAQAAELASVFVPTAAYSNALQTLASHNFVVLTGPPEMGKTAIARMIGLAKLGEGWECFECQHPEDVLKLRTGDQKRIFIADDAFGTTEFRPEVAHAWAADMDRILRVVNEKRWLIWTSRPAPLHAALQRMHLQGKAERFPQPAEVLVDAEKLSNSEKALILYRHAKAANLEEQAKALVRRFAGLIIYNDHFTPERVRRFVNDALPRLKIEDANDEIVQQTVVSTIEHPTESMKKSLEALSQPHKLLLIAMLDAGQGVVLGKNLVAAHNRISEDAEDINKLVNDLSSHFLRVENKGHCHLCGSLIDDSSIHWMHPSWRDLLIERLASEATTRQEFLAKCGIEGFLLAVSSAGGATGKRQAPLIKSDKDLQAASIAAYRLIMNEVRYSTWRLLTSVLEFLRRIENETNQNPSVTKLALTEFNMNVLSACRKRWERKGEFASASDLAAYYSISENVSPLPPGPNLSNLWEQSLAEAVDEMENFDEDEGELRIDGVNNWLNMVSIIEDNEPRFLRQIGFPDKFAKQFEDFLPPLARRAKAELELEDTDACNTEAANLDMIQELAESCRIRFPTLSGLINELTTAINDADYDVRRMRERIKEKELEEQEWDREEPRYMQGSTHLAPPRRTEPATKFLFAAAQGIGHLDLGKLFEDL